MSRATRTSQDEPTKPRPVSAEGRALDGWGLPLNGPARLRALEEAGKPDPNDDPAVWAAPADKKD